MPVPSADIESKANEPTLVILLSPKETLPLNVPPFAEDTASAGENADMVIETSKNGAFSGFYYID